MKPGNCCSRGVQKVARTLQDLLTIPTPQIVVAQYHDGRAAQVWSEHTLTACIEAIAVNKGNSGLMHGADVAADCLLLHPRSPAHRPLSQSAVGTWDFRSTARTAGLGAKGV